MKEKNILVFLFVLLIVNIAALETSKILYINSYHKGYKWSDEITNTLNNNLTSPETNTKLFIEYLDSKRFTTKAHQKEFYNYLLSKYKNVELNLLISSDDNAFTFLLENRDDLFGEIPYIFCGVNYLDKSRLDKITNITGINEYPNIEETMNLALRLHPQKKNFYIINDKTTSGRRNHIEFKRIESELSNQYSFNYLNDMTFDEIVQKVESLGEKDVIVLSLITEDAAGNKIDYDFAAKTISEKAPVPVYALWDFYLGYGVVGGKMSSAYFQAQGVTHLAKEVLKEGRKISTIPVKMKSPNHYLFDYKAMQRFKIKSKNLPEESRVYNKPESFYSKNKEIILITLLALITELIIILLLLINRRKRIKAEEQAKRSEALLNDVLEAASESAIVATDKDGYIKFINSGVTNIFGYTPKDVIEKKTPEIFYRREYLEDNKRKIRKKYHANVDSFKSLVYEAEINKVTKTELELLDKKGENVFVSLVITCIKNEFNEIKGYLGVMQNISELKLREIKLSEQNAYLQTVERMTFALYQDKGIKEIIKASLKNLSKYLKADKIALVLLGEDTSYNKAYSIENNIISSQEIPPTQVDNYLNSINTENNSGDICINIYENNEQISDVKTVSLEYEDLQLGFICIGWKKEKKLSEKFVRNLTSLIHIICLALSDNFHLLQLEKEINNKIDAQNKLRRSKQRLESFAETLPDLAFIMDEKGNYVEVLSSKHSLLLHSKDKLVGTNIKDSLPEDVSSKIFDLIRKIMHKKDVASVEYSLDIAGEIHWFELRASPFIEEGDKKFIPMIGRDITKRKKAEQKIKDFNKNLLAEVEKKTEQYREANKDLENFAYSISHDLRSPLRHISGFVNILKENLSELESEDELFLSKILNSTNKMNKMLNDLLIFSRIGRKNLQIEKLDLEKIISDIVDDYRLTNKKIEWKIRNIPQIKADKKQMQRVIENLISNAVKYSSKEEKPKIEISGKKTTTQTHIFVKDNGIGFDENQKDELFMVFKRLHSDKEFKGIGVGLANVKRIIKRHQGTIKASSKEGEGAVFEFAIPL